jgi:hypothetical protein
MSDHVPGYVEIDHQNYNPERIEGLEVTEEVDAAGTTEAVAYRFRYTNAVGQKSEVNCVSFGSRKRLVEQIERAMTERRTPGYVDPYWRTQADD